MTFCDYLSAALDAAPNADAKASVQALIDKYCGTGVHSDGGGLPASPPHK